MMEYFLDHIGVDALKQNFDVYKAAYVAQLVINNPENEDLNEIASKKFRGYM